MLSILVVAVAARNELWSEEEARANGIVWRGNSSESSSHDLLEDVDYPDEFTWCNKSGVNYCTMSRNQHIPQYCGSCWAHGAISALGDRIKIARGAKGIDVNLAVQHVLNCGNVGSCHGGTVDGPYQWIHSISKSTGTGIAYESSNPYLACSSESKDGVCKGQDWSCTPMNVARTCSTFPEMGGKCVGLKNYPNATIAEYGSIMGKNAMMKEIYNRGPISCGIDASKIEKYTGGIATGWSFMVDHVISVVGWGKDAEHGQYWIVRNSWGEYWGEMGYIRVKFGALAVQEQCSWATLASYSAPEMANVVPCYEDGSNCLADEEILTV